MIFYTQQDINCIKDLYENSYNLLISIANGILGNKDDAEEIVHDVYLKIADNFNRYKRKPVRELRSLAVVITKHMCINHINKKSRQKEVLVEPCSITGYYQSVQDEYFKRFRELQVRNAIDKLKEEDRIILILRYYHDMKYSDISKTLSISKKSVEMRLRRARNRLREILENE